MKASASDAGLDGAAAPAGFGSEAERSARDRRVPWWSSGKAGGGGTRSGQAETRRDSHRSPASERAVEMPGGEAPLRAGGAALAMVPPPDASSPARHPAAQS